MKLLKKNQVIVYVIVLMLMTAGYLNYTTNTEKQASIETAMQIEANDDRQLADIGDATLVNSNEVVTKTEENMQNIVDTEIVKEKEEKEEVLEEEEKAMETGVNSSKTDDYFTKSKLERDTMYSQMIGTYEKVLNSTNAMETQKQSATQEIQKLNDTKNSIMICENLIRTKGFENNVVFVNGSSVSIIVGAIEIKPEEVAQIQNIIAREMKVEIENIHIANK